MSGVETMYEHIVMWVSSTCGCNRMLKSQWPANDPEGHINWNCQISLDSQGKKRIVAKQLRG